MEIEKSVDAQKAYFATGATLPVSYRLEMLKLLRTAIKAHESDIIQALKTTWENPNRKALCAKSAYFT